MKISIFSVRHLLQASLGKLPLVMKFETGLVEISAKIICRATTSGRDAASCLLKEYASHYLTGYDTSLVDRSLERFAKKQISIDDSTDPRFIVLTFTL